MILGNKGIRKAITDGYVVYEVGCVDTPINIQLQITQGTHIVCNSIDVHTTDELWIGRPNLIRGKHEVNDPKLPQLFDREKIPVKGTILFPGRRYLMTTAERIGTTMKYVPMYDGRSSIGRLHLASHVTAGFGDVGFVGQWTLEVWVVEATVIYPWTKIGQVSFHQVSDSTLTYPMKKSSYVDQKGIVPSKLYIKGV